MTISSRSNPLLRRARRLRIRSHREESQTFFVEGIAPVRAALEQEAATDVVLMAPDLLTSEAAVAAVRAAEAAGVTVEELTADAFASISARDNPVGLAAIVRTFDVDPSRIELGPRDVAVALFDVANPGNLGTVLRTADAAGCAAVILVGESCDPWHPTAVKASMGSLFRVPLGVAPALDDLWEWAARRGAAVVTTSATAPVRLWEAPLRLPVVALFGSEARGLPPDVVDRGDVALAIPMWGATDSLNLGVAAGILLYEIRRRAEAPETDGQTVASSQSPTVRQRLS